MYDAVVVGGGAAGLSAALVLGRARRRVLVCDTQQPRNAASPAAHSVFTRDGTAPSELLAIGRAQLAPYGVELRSVAVTQAHKADHGFQLTLADGEHVCSRTVVLATGVRDVLPPIAGIDAFWGTSVLHCPYCHGWEVRDQPIAVLGIGDVAVYLTYLLRNWSTDLVLCTNGPGQLTSAQQDRIASLDIEIYEQPIVRLTGAQAQLERIHLIDGTVLERHALFLRPAQEPQSRLAHNLGCTIGEDGLVVVDEHGQTSVPGIYAAGDMTRQAQQIIFAAADGARAAIAINHAFVLGELG
jgi:thioredoxin reductase